MHRSNRNHSETERGGGVGGNGGLFRCGLCGPPNKGDDFHALLNDRLKQIMDPNYEIPKNDTTERKFLGQCRLYIGNLVDCTEEELIEIFKPYGEVFDIFFVRELMIGFIKLDYRTNAEKAKRELDGQTRKGHMLKIRFAPICDAAIIVDNLVPCVSNELLKYVFSVFGDIERCWLMVDKKR